MSSGDKLQRMLERQREREEALKKKEAERANQEAAKKAEVNAAAMAKMPQAAVAKKAEAPATPQDAWFTKRKDIYAPIPPMTRGKPVLLGGDPNGENVLFCVGNSVIIRNISNPLISDIYSEHSYPTTVARYSPDRKFIASGDQSGMLRIWHVEIVQGIAHKLKLEKKALGGAISDIEWDSESKRVMAVGQGRDKYGVIFFAESGAGAGEITGHSKSISSCSWRPTKPYKIITGGEDFLMNWFECPPVKWKHSLQNHSNFVNCIRFSPNGKFFVTCGQDKKAFIGDGESGQILRPLEGHNGGIYANSWSPDSTEVLTVSGDKSAKIWDPETGTCKQTFSYGNDVEDQLLGCLWQGEHIIVLNLAGHMIYVDRNQAEPKRIVRGHNKSIEAMAIDRSKGYLYSGSYDAIMYRWNINTGETTPFKGAGHTNAVKSIVLQGDNIITCGLDDTVRITSASTLTYNVSIKVEGVPAGVAVAGDVVVCGHSNGVAVIKNNAIASSLSVSYRPQAIAISPDGKQVAVGGEDMNIHLYAVSGNNLTEDGVLKGHRGILTRLDYSPDGKWLTSADRNRDVMVFDVQKKELKQKDWVFHTARIDGLSFSPNSQYIASTGLDQTIIIWSLENPTSRITIKGAHQGGITEILWVDDKTVITSGQDCTIRTWNVL